MEADFSGYATRANVKCSDGRTIMRDAFKHNDGTQVPLVWQHGHSDPNNVLGHALLENREDGVYAYGFFNDTEAAQNAKLSVEHGDIDSLSIYANRLREENGNVQHGDIREVSLVLAGANPQARIDQVYIKHSDGFEEEVEDEAVIFSGESLMHAEEEEEMTIDDVVASMDEDQRAVLNFLVGKAAEEAGNNNADGESAEHSDSDTDEGLSLIHISEPTRRS